MNRKLKLLIAASAISALCAGAALAATSPTVSTGPVSSVRQTGVVLHGAVDPHGTKTYYVFDWGTSTAYGLHGGSRSAGSGNKSVAVQELVTGLAPGTVYHYRLSALDIKGAGAAGSDRTFKTAGNPPPGAATGAATAVGRNTTTLNGVVYPNGQATGWYFRYGTAAGSYPLQTAEQAVAAGTAPVSVAAQLTFLQPGKIIHYQLVAVNRGLVEAGADQTFMTLPDPTPVPRIRARTRPGTARHRPFVFTTSGHISGPRWIPDNFACTQNVTVKFFNGRRRVGEAVLPVQPNCTFSGQTVFRHLPHHERGQHQVTLRVTIRYAGNGYLASRSARTEHVTLG
jgi:hypothetical protein